MTTLLKTQDPLTLLKGVAGFFLLAPLLAPAHSNTCDDKREKQLSEIQAAEMSFAAAAQEMPTRDAFIKFLAPDSILFRPGPVDGQTHMQGVTPGSGTLEWGPRHVDMAAAGDLGFTFGPWVSRDAEGTAVGWGEYISMWKRQPDGSLKVVLDTGTVFPEPGEEETAEALVRPIDSSKIAVEIEDVQLLQRDTRDGGAIHRPGSSARVFRMGHPSRMQEVDERSPDKGLSWNPVDAKISASGDIGYSYGTLESDDGEMVESYLHIWRCCVESDWVLLVDVHVGQ